MGEGCIGLTRLLSKKMRRRPVHTVCHHIHAALSEKLLRNGPSTQMHVGTEQVLLGEHSEHKRGQRGVQRAQQQHVDLRRHPVPRRDGLQLVERVGAPHVGQRVEPMQRVVHLPPRHRFAQRGGVVTHVKNHGPILVRQEEFARAVKPLSGEAGLVNQRA